MALLKGLGLSDAIIEAKRFKRERAKLMKWGQKGFDRRFVYVDMSQNQGNDSKVLVYNHSRLRRSGRTCYFGPEPKAGAPGTVEDNLIDLCDEEDD
ncbi:hypothetical protein MTR_7g061690 [Medicago truncatula]|uniref:Uncharacterized protein n=1 Tax=Medicago truncatula TaxID=3880 RepID=A0A072TZI5_MEDTR|nr:hypothetical protein MTR_7g061690 [Medicago truncatula]